MVQNRSALLMTTILALGSTALATLPDGTDEQVAEALHLHAHAEKLNLVVYTTGARSIEIIQAQIVRVSKLAFFDMQYMADVDSFCRAGEFPGERTLTNSGGYALP